MRGLVLILGLFGSLQLQAAQKPDCSQFSKAVTAGAPAEKLKKFLDTNWKYMMREYPEYATFVGYPGQDDRWSDMSMDTIDRRKDETICALDALKKIPRDKLGAKDK